MKPAGELLQEIEALWDRDDGDPDVCLTFFNAADLVSPPAALIPWQRRSAHPMAYGAGRVAQLGRRAGAFLRACLKRPAWSNRPRLRPSDFPSLRRPTGC